jgi:uncharacterized protein
MIKRLVLKAIEIFQMTRPLRKPACRFFPSCSDYAHAAIERHGILSGAALSAWRLLRCHPLHPGGVEFVPEKPLFPGSR